MHVVVHVLLFKCDVVLLNCIYSHILGTVYWGMNVCVKRMRVLPHAQSFYAH